MLSGTCGGIQRPIPHSSWNGVWGPPLRAPYLPAETLRSLALYAALSQQASHSAWDSGRGAGGVGGTGCLPKPVIPMTFGTKIS